MTSQTTRRLLITAITTTILGLTLAFAELRAQPPEPAQPATPPAPPGTPPPPAPITSGQPGTTSAQPAPQQPASPASPSTPYSTPATPAPGTTTLPPGQIGPPVSMTGCVKRIERMDTDNAAISDLINRPM